MIDEPVTVESTLSHPAAKLYIHLLNNWLLIRTVPQLLRGAGIGDRRTLRAALQELSEKRLLDLETGKVAFPGSNVGAVPNFVGATPNNVGADTTKVGADTNGSHSHKSGSQSQQSGNDYHSPIENVELDLREADAMPADGDERNMASNFQLRRKRQLMLLEQAWLVLFPKQPPLQPLTAKNWLIAAHSEAMTVFEAMQQTAARNIEHPITYTKKVIESAAAKKTLKVEELGTDRPVTPEQRAQWDRYEQYAKDLGISWEDDD